MIPKHLAYLFCAVVGGAMVALGFNGFKRSMLDGKTPKPPQEKESGEDPAFFPNPKTNSNESEG